MRLRSGAPREPLDDAAAAAVVEEMQRGRLIVPPTVRESFTARYVIALLLIAVLSLGAGYSGVRLVNAQSDAAAEVNVAGRQRMLSQRIALDASLLADAAAGEHGALRETLLADIELMAVSQAALLTGDGTFGIVEPPSASIRQRFDNGLAASVTSFLDDARTVAGDPEDQATLERIQSQATGALLPELDAVVQAYQTRSERQIDAIAREEKFVLGATLLALVLEAVYVFRPMSRRITEETVRLQTAAARHRSEADRHSFGLKLREAVDLADTEDELIETIEHACSLSGVSGDFEFLHTDPEMPRAIVPIAPDEAPLHHCSVASADNCPAIRRGRTLQFDGSEQLGACPNFRRDARAAGDGEQAAICAPVTFRGTGLGVIRSVTSAGESRLPSEVEELSMVARTAGTHIGTLRAFEATRADAEHDALTGLLNRRGLDERVQRLEDAGIRFVVGLVDLDHFKRVNDDNGHDAGDVALVETSRIMESVLRPNDLLARQGGEEFVVVLPMPPDQAIGDDLASGVAVAERIRVALESATTTSSLRLCTGSIGVSAAPDGLEGALQRADVALYRAKDQGRNRVEVEGDLSADIDQLLDSGEPAAPDSSS